MKSFLNNQLVTDHDKKLLPILMVVIILFLASPDFLINLVNQSDTLSYIAATNPFVARMAQQSHPHDFAIFCYLLSFFMMPYFFFVLINSESIKKGLIARYERGGSFSLIVSALFAVTIYIVLFFFFKDFTPESVSRINYFMFHSRFGIAIFSIGFTYFLTLMLVTFIKYTSEFIKKISTS